MSAATLNKDVAIHVKDLSRMYKMYSKPSHLLIEALTQKTRHQERWVLKGVSFDIGNGEIVGIIGANGAGKSTLLKIIAGTLEKTSGDVVINGRISAILELGTGFHQQYSGRENIILGGMCLGLSKEEATEKVDWIIEFSELSSVIDHPFHTYSSGMQARLTFATAVSVDPDILIVDEALATGDAYFVNKCLKRIKNICESGATVLFVSHSESLISDLCDRAIWIEDGQMVEIGEARLVADNYYNHVWSIIDKNKKIKNKDILLGIQVESKKLLPSGCADKNKLVKGFINNIDFHINEIISENENGEIKHVFMQGEDINIKVIWSAGNCDVGEVTLGMRIDGPKIDCVSGFASKDAGYVVNGGSSLPKSGAFTFCIKGNRFGTGDHFFSFGIHTKDVQKNIGSQVYYAPRVYTFSVYGLKSCSETYIYAPEVKLYEKYND